MMYIISCMVQSSWPHNTSIGSSFLKFKLVLLSCLPILWGPDQISINWKNRVSHEPLPRSVGLHGGWPTTSPEPRPCHQNDTLVLQTTCGVTNWIRESWPRLFANNVVWRQQTVPFPGVERLAIRVMQTSNQHSYNLSWLKALKTWRYWICTVFPSMVVPDNHWFSYIQLKMIILGCFGGTTI